MRSACDVVKRPLLIAALIVSCGWVVTTYAHPQGTPELVSAKKPVPGGPGHGTAGPPEERKTVP